MAKWVDGAIKKNEFDSGERNSLHFEIPHMREWRNGRIRSLITSSLSPKLSSTKKNHLTSAI